MERAMERSLRMWDLLPHGALPRLRSPISPSHHITSKQTPNPKLQSVSESNQKAHMLPQCIRSIHMPLKCFVNQYHFPELSLSFAELSLSYLTYYKVNSAHTTCGKQNWIYKTDSCTLRQQLIDSNLCQRQGNLRGTQNLGNARADSYIHPASFFSVSHFPCAKIQLNELDRTSNRRQTVKFSHLKYLQKAMAYIYIYTHKKN